MVKGYRLRWVPRDLFAAFAVSAMLVAQGMAFVILASQLGDITGTRIEAQGFFSQLREFWDRIDSIHLPTTLLSLLTIAFIFGARLVAPRFPGTVVAVSITTASSMILGWGDEIAIVGEIDTRLPRPALPPFPEGEALGRIVPGMHPRGDRPRHPGPRSPCGPAARRDPREDRGEAGLSRHRYRSPELRGPGPPDLPGGRPPLLRQCALRPRAGARNPRCDRRARSPGGPRCGGRLRHRFHRGPGARTPPRGTREPRLRLGHRRTARADPQGATADGPLRGHRRRERLSHRGRGASETEFRRVGPVFLGFGAAQRPKRCCRRRSYTWASAAEKQQKVTRSGSALPSRKETTSSTATTEAFSLG